jgi:hypothetical protein
MIRFHTFDVGLPLLPEHPAAVDQGIKCSVTRCDLDFCGFGEQGEPPMRRTRGSSRP